MDEHGRELIRRRRLVLPDVLNLLLQRRHLLALGAQLFRDERLFAR